MPPRSTLRESRLRAARLAMKDEKPRACIDASVGPWWGFNGVKTLVVTDAALYIVSTRVSRFTTRLPAVQRVTRREVRRVEVGAHPKHALVRITTQKREFTLRAEEGKNSPAVEEFVQALRS